MKDELVERLGDAIMDAILEHGTWDKAILARSFLSAIESAGLVIVPREPTEEMVRCEPYESQFPPDTSESIKQSWRDEYAKIYRAMLAASPKHL